MHAFRDCDGQEWLVKINVSQLRRVKASLGLDLVGLLADGLQPLGRLLGEPVELVNVLYLLCKEEADGRGVGDEQFGRRMAGDALGQAADAFVEELIHFFPESRRPLLRAVVGKGRDVGARMAEEAMREVESLDVERILQDWLKRSGGTSGGAPESSAPTPAPSPSGS